VGVRLLAVLEGSGQRFEMWQFKNKQGNEGGARVGIGQEVGEGR
jgi:hypothetical protein